MSNNCSIDELDNGGICSCANWPGHQSRCTIAFLRELLPDELDDLEVACTQTRGFVEEESAKSPFHNFSWHTCSLAIPPPHDQVTFVATIDQLP